MSTNNIFPMNWDDEQDNVLFGSLFSDNINSLDSIVTDNNYEGSFAEDIINPNKPLQTIVNGIYKIYGKLFSYSNENQTSDGYFLDILNVDKNGFHIHYTSNNKNLFLIYIGNGLYTYLINRISQDNETTYKNIYNFCKSQDSNFPFSQKEISDKFKKEIADADFYNKNIQPKNEPVYAENIRQLKSLLKNPKDQKSIELISKINILVSKMDIEASITFSAIGIENANPFRSFSKIGSKTFGYNELLKLHDQLSGMQDAIKKLKKGDFKSAEEFLHFVNIFFVARNDSQTFLIHYPFISLENNTRAKLISILISADEGFYKQNSINSNITNGEVVLALLNYCEEKERLKIIFELEKADKLYWLLSLSYFSTFNELTLLIGNTYLNSIQDKKADLINDAIEKGNHIFFNTNLFGTHNKENFDDENKKITFEVKENLVLSIFPEQNLIRQSIEQGTDTYKELFFTKKGFNPLDLIVLTPIVDTEYNGIQFVKGEPHLMPACLAYYFFKQETIDTIQTIINITFQTALCFIGVGSVIAAVRAGSVASAVIGTTDFAIGIGGVVVNSVPEIKRNHPDFVKYYNYFTWIWVVCRIVGTTGKAFKNKKKDIGNSSNLYTTEKELLDFVKSNKIKVTEVEIKTVLNLVQSRKDLSESILLSAKEIIEGKTVAQLVKKFRIQDVPVEGSLSNYQSRIWYSHQKSKIEAITRRITNLEKKAKTSFELRNLYRTEARKYMSDRKLAEYLSEFEKNGEWAKFLEYTLKKPEVNGNLEAAYHKIIESSQTGRDKVDELFKLIKI